MSLLKKIRGDGAPLPPQSGFKAAALGWLGGFLAIATVAVLTNYLSIALVLGSFGASCVLRSQPRSAPRSPS